MGSETMNRRERLRSSKVYLSMQQVSRYMDQYYIDGIVGLIPGGLGDAVSALFSLTHVYFSLFRLRSISLTLAILNNILRDILLGMIPFFVGDIIDFFHRANSRNMTLIDGFIEEDATIVQQVNAKAIQSLVVLMLLAAGIALLAWLLARLIRLI